MSGIEGKEHDTILNFLEEVFYSEQALLDVKGEAWALCDGVDMKRKIADLLRGTRARISAEDNWCQHSYALTEYAMNCTANSPLSRSWCMTGSLAAEVFKRYGDDCYKIPEARALTGCAVRFLEHVLSEYDETCCDCLSIFNDKSKHRDVIGFLDQAIDLLKGLS